MKSFLIVTGMAACIAMCADYSLGAPRGGRGGGGGGNVGAAVGGAVDGAAKVDAGANVNAGPTHIDAGPAHVDAGPGGANVDVGGPKAGVNVDAGRRGAEVNIDRRDGDRNRDNDRNRNQSNRGRIGDREWDRWGVGALDVDRYRNARGNDWRYRHWGNDWFYWMPAGYWMYYRDGRWDRYNSDTYTYGDYDNGNAVQTANFNGPYYEDSQGFYYIQGGRRVYDPQIQRVAGREGPVQR